MSKGVGAPADAGADASVAGQDASAGRAGVVLSAALRLMRPIARLLLRHGINHRTFSVALKSVFLAAAQDELKARGMARTDSALTLLSGVHRRDVRTLLREPPAAAERLARPASLASEVVGRWLSQHRMRAGRGTSGSNPRGATAVQRVLPRGSADGSTEGSFNHLVASVSRDIRPRALLDELLRLGVVEETDAGVRLLAESFTPREGFAEIASITADNLHDHLAAAAENLQGLPAGPNHLEQSVFVDEITQASAEQLRRAAVLAWKQAFQTVMSEAQTRFDHDAQHTTPAERTQRARFGVYFYATAMQTSTAEPDPS